MLNNRKNEFFWRNRNLKKKIFEDDSRPDSRLRFSTPRHLFTGFNTAYT